MEFTENFPLTALYVNRAMQENAQCILAQGVEVCVEVVETLKIGDFTKIGMQDEGKRGPVYFL